MNRYEKLDKKSVPYEAIIQGLSHEGRGIATICNKTTFIAGALPDEKVICTITKKHRQYQDAEVTEILQASPQRITPPCEYFGTCGGCSLQHMDIATQTQFKQQTLLDQLTRIGHVTPQHILLPLQATTTGYRRKARIGVKFVIKKEKVFVGFREKSSRYLTDLKTCAVLHPRVGQHLSDLSELITSLEQYQHIPQIEVAIGDTDAALVFRHLESLPITDQEKLIAFGKKYDFHIYLQPNSPAPFAKIWPADNHQRLTYTLPDSQLEFLFHPLDFTQINLEVNRLMVKQAVELLALQPQDQVLDLFCGIGNFTLPIARHAQFVTGVEGSLDMVQRAEQNAAHNNIQNVCFYAANLEEPLAQVSWSKTHYNKIILDPPRAGAKTILPIVNQCAAEKLIYISCNPATLARDAGELVHQYGYTLSQVGIINMFPHTSHIETMAVFDKR